MYKKVLIKDKYLKPNKHDLKWLLAKRLNVKFNDEGVILNDKIIYYHDFSSTEVLSYRTFMFFKIYSILSFKHNNQFYQIGIDNSEMQIIVQKLKISISNESLTIKDFIFFVIIILSFTLMIYNFLK